jgi:hypothetical protein
MEHILIKLKRFLNSIDDTELKEMDLWIDNAKQVDVIALDNNAITLVTDENSLKINDKQW